MKTEIQRTGASRLLATVLGNLDDLYRGHPEFEVSPTDWNDICWWGSLVDRLDKVLDQRVMAACRAAAMTDPTRSNLRETLAFSLARRGEWEEAIRQYELAGAARLL